MSTELEIQIQKSKLALSKGGPGSGNFGHAGRPGQVGGSAPADGAGAGEEEFSSSDAIRGMTSSGTWRESSEGFVASGKTRVEINHARRQAEGSLSKMGYTKMGSGLVRDHGTGPHAISISTRHYQSKKGYATLTVEQAGWSGGGKLQLTFLRDNPLAEGG